MCRADSSYHVASVLHGSQKHTLPTLLGPEAWLSQVSRLLLLQSVTRPDSSMMVGLDVGNTLGMDVQCLYKVGISKLPAYMLWATWNSTSNSMLLAKQCPGVPTGCTCALQAIDLINKLAVELDIDAAMRSVRDCALELLECDKVTLFLIIEPRRELR
eukprot:GHRQ01027179.1.p2 GENE.GHRQ01027179.1~~GHRQ01027179.1.p2  ORF type:complete len:158 (+),score=36.87 GHRQ01027179.1:621-1094(+)